MSIIPRGEYPRPQFVREDWLCLNGEWQFEIDSGNSGKERGLRERELTGKIVVPFCPESTLSGVGNVDFLHAVWYRKTVAVPPAWAGRRVLLHFQAVDYDATVWVNGKEVVRHRGGFTPFTADLGGIAEAGKKITIVVRARDSHQGAQPLGKQSVQYAPHSCFYTRTTGIWQSVWLEPIPKFALKRPRITPEVGQGLFRIQQAMTGNLPGSALRVTLSDSGGRIAVAECSADMDLSPTLEIPVPEDRRILWEPDQPHLYDFRIELLDREGIVVDRATSYGGLRSLALCDNQFLLNGKPIFQRLVLDQGYYPDGVMTAPTDDSLRQDITLAMEAGFNGARLHQKVFEERFLFHADQLGYLIWGEFADWGSSGLGPVHDHQRPGVTYIAQWLEALERDYSHPCIIGWCALNETSQTISDNISVLDDATRALFLAAKAIDQTRPVLDASGYAHRVPESDVYDSHDYIYEDDFGKGIEKFRKRHSKTAQGKVFVNGVDARDRSTVSLPYRGQPYFVSEFGGFRYVKSHAARTAQENHLDRTESWGYGSDPETKEDFYARFEAVCRALLENPAIFGYCYTQLTDIDPEENGIYFFNREKKFDTERLKEIQGIRAAYEKCHESE